MTCATRSPNPCCTQELESTVTEARRRLRSVVIYVGASLRGRPESRGKGAPTEEDAPTVLLS